MPLLELELLTLPVHLSSHRYLAGFVLLDLLGFYVVFCISLFVLLSSNFPLSLLGMIRSRKMTKPYTSSIKAGGSMSQVVGSNNSYKPITNTAWVRAQLCKLQKGCTRLAAASNKVYQLLAQGRWFSPGTPASSTTKICRHNIAEILLKVALNTKIQIQIHIKAKLKLRG